MFFLRPRSQAARRQRDTLMELSAGDEVLTGAGIFGTVLDVESDRVTLETAPGTRITVLRSTIARRITDPAADTPSWDEHDEDEAHGAYHEYEHGHDDEPSDTTTTTADDDEADARGDADTTTAEHTDGDDGQPDAETDGRRSETTTPRQPDGADDKNKT